MRIGLPMLALGFAACGDNAPGLAPEVNALGLGSNALPYPASIYERSDASSPTGVRVDVPIGALPASKLSGTAFDPTRLDQRTGWPAALSILWQVEGGVDPTTLVPATNIGASLDGTGSTAIIDMMTGERVAHFAEVDANVTSDLTNQAIYLRPAQRLVGGHRYAVGVRRAVTHPDGSPLQRTAGFQAVIDDVASGSDRLDAARPRLREAVAALDAAGVPDSDLVVAWDFTVEDDASAIADPVAARDSALAAMGPLGASLTYTITDDEGTVMADPRIARRISIDFTTPEVAGPGLEGYHRGSDGLPMASGSEVAHAFLMVPPCATAGTPAGILMYGHGFFGDLNELKTSEYLRDLSADGCLVVAGTEWVGMSSSDLQSAFAALGDLSSSAGFGERVWQGMVNTIALEQLLRGAFASTVLVDDTGASIVDPTRLYFLGISQGSILGATFVAYDPFITRGVLHVGGENWSVLFERSNEWEVFGAPLKSSYPTPPDASLMQEILEIGMEQVDGATAGTMNIPGTPDKQILQQMSVGDAQVPNLAALFQARTLGMTLITPAAAMPWGFEAAQGPSATQRGFVIVDESPTPLPPDSNVTFDFSNDAHENPRRRTAIQQMMRDFWSTGEIHNTCSGACQCATGACGDLRGPMYGGT